MVDVQIRRTRVTIAGAALAMAFAMFAWQRWFHEVLLDDGETRASGGVFGFVRDLGVLWVLAGAAVVAGLWLVDRRFDGGPAPVRRMWQALAFSVAFGGAVAVAVVLDRTIFPGAAISGAPGAGYLLEDGGFTYELSHALRDSLIAQLVVLPVAWATTRFFGPGVASPTVAASTAAAAPAVPAGAAVPADRRPVPEPDGRLSRRAALQYGTAGTFIAALGSSGVVTLTSSAAHAEENPDVTPWLSQGIELFINDGTKRMIDGTPVYMWGWGFRSEGVDESTALHTPGPVIWTHEGETVELNITNTLNEAHSFVIDGVVDSGVIAPGASTTVSFTAPAAGTYLYQDGTNRPVHRVLGLHGALLVMPADQTMRLSTQLPLEHWTFDTQWVWIFNQIDPAFNAIAQAERPIDVNQFKANFKPRYFTINGRMGSLASHVETAPDTVIEDNLFNPALIRIVNAGYATHCPHIHGNHCFVLARNARVQSTIMWKDQFRVGPEETTDLHLPFNVPPNALYWPPHPDGAAFLRELHGTDMEGKFPMHCHIEQSQTAAGGLYPQGLLTDWKIK